MEILSSIVGKVAEHTVVPIGHQASYLIFYEGNISMLAVHVKDLEVAKERITHSVEEEKRNGKNIERDVMNWLEKVDGVIEKANQLQNHPRRANARCSAWPFPNLILRHQLSRKATKIVKDVIQVQGKGVFGRIGYPPILDGEASSSSTRGGENYETRESLKESIMKALTHHNSGNIGVYGLGGVGKTTLVREVFEISTKLKLFDAVVKTHVSKTPDIKKIQGEIADFLGLRFDEESISGRARRLRQRIMLEKNILIVLDDIWTILDLEKVGIPFGIEHNGCKLLMTSRNQDVLLQMDVLKDFTFKLGLMIENEAWSLFQFKAGDVVKDSNLKGVAIQVANECAGLPLVIVTVAQALKHKRDVQTWKDALRRLQCDHDKKFSALELSYDSLESDEMRDVFLLFALLPTLSVEYFLKVAMGLDILKDIKTVDDARNCLYSIIRSLEATCLLELKTSGNIQMHDIVRDFAISVARRDKHVFLKKQSDEEYPTNDFLTRCAQVVLDSCCMHKLPQTIDCPNIKLFCLCSEDLSSKIPDNLFEGMRSLRVLDLTYLNLSSLPTSFRFLTDLKTLCLDVCILENMVEIQALQNLEILCLWNSSMTKLPTEIGKLTQLRMLDLSNSGIEVIPPNILSSLTKLEELYMGNTSVNWNDVNSTVQNRNASIAELQKLPNLTSLELQIRETWMLPRHLQTVFEKLQRYKIAIGDVWEWADIDDDTSKTLMLKLGTNIHSEHGIKTLIKGVENLYLDDVDGIQNVLYQLNGEGFPLLKYLHIQNNANMNHIVDSQERNLIHVTFPILETLVLHNLKNLEHISLGPLSTTSFGKLSVIEVKNCVQLKYLFSVTMFKELSHLSKIKVCQCNSMKDIVLGDNNSSASTVFWFRSLTLEHLETLQNFFSRSEQKHQGLESSVSTPMFNDQVAFPNLETLKLSSLNLNKIWNDNHHSMCNLTSLIVESCGGLKYLFLSSMVGSFKNLKQLEISNCPLMEEVIAKDDRNNEIEEVHCFKLEKITLKDMDNLKTIWHRQFETVKMLQVNNCKKIVVVFPSTMQKTYNKLEMLEVTDCALVEDIFELTFDENSSVENTTHLKVIIDELPKLKNIWSGDLHRILSFQILIVVKLTNCASLEYLLPLSIATRCSHLQELHINGCENMKEIVAEEKESRLSAVPTFEFSTLSRLLLWNLDKLKGFYAKEHTVACSSLKEIDVCNCAKLNLYGTLSTRSSNFQDAKLSVVTPQPPFIVEEVIPNLEELRINHKEANVILQAQNSSALFTKLTSLYLTDYNIEDAAFPYWFLQNVHNLESLLVQWSCFKKIFQDEGQISEKKTYPQLKKLTLNGLHKLQHICEEGFQIDPVLAFLERLIVCRCSSLLSLLPSSATLNHLEYLEITNCNGLKKLITSPTARNLEKLISLKIKDCNSLEEIITGEENVGIAFISLELLMLDCLPSLNKFCSSKCFLKFPLLEEVIVTECPRMQIFSEGNTSTPNLQKVKIAENDEWLWKGNLNDTMTNIFENKVAFDSFKHLKLSEYPELKEFWYGQPRQNVFRSLKYLVVHNCDFLSEVLFQPNLLEVLMNLEELDIKDCKSLEAIFYLKGGFEKEILVKNSTQLKKLKLSNLPKLKHVWKEDQHNTMGFQNLSEVSVKKCTSLKSLFPLSVARDMKQIQRLKVTSCGIEEIVGMEEGVDEIVEFAFPNLTFIRLHHLAELKAFFAGVHSLQCKSLKTINLFRCPKIELFKAEPLRHQESARKDEFNISMYQPLFPQHNVFQSLKYLVVHNCDFLSEVLFQPNLVELLMNLEELDIKDCKSLEAVFDLKGGFEKEILVKNSTQLKKLNLSNLPKMKHVWKEDQHNTMGFQNLNEVSVEKCTSLKSLFSLSVARDMKQIQILKVIDSGIEEIVGMEEGVVEMVEFVFPNLTSIKLQNLAELKAFFAGLHSLQCKSLKTINLFRCPKIELFKAEPLRHQESAINDEFNISMYQPLFVIEEVAFPNLETLKLRSLNLNKIWNDNHHSMCNLTSLIVESCGELKYLFLSTMVGSFKNLKQLEISNCPLMEEIIAKEERNNEIEEVHFFKLEKITLKDMDNLNTIWHRQFETVKMLQVSNCKKIVVVFPSSMQNTYSKLEMLEVTDCALVEKIFELGFIQNSSVENTTHLKIVIDGLPELKNIWSGDLHSILSFQILIVVRLTNCANLEYLLPLSIATRCSHLTELHIKHCRNMKEIVAEEKESRVSAAPTFEFNQLSSLWLWNLDKLKGFYAKEHIVACSSLKEIDVYNCAKLNLYRTLSTRSSDFQDDKLSVVTPQPPFIVEEVIPNLKELRINHKEANVILQAQNSSALFSKMKFLCLTHYIIEDAAFPYWFLQNVHTLESLLVEWSCFKKIFQDEGQISEKKTYPRLKLLTLRGLQKLKHICEEGFQIDPVLAFLEQLKVFNCSSLISLLPSSATLHHLEYLEIMGCNGLRKLITSSTTQNLHKLVSLKVKDCNSLEEIITGEENVGIAFISLEFLMLDSLPSLNKFCSSKCFLKFPLLEEVIVTECPRMKIFSEGNTSTPNLRKVKIAENDEWLWKGNLNDTITNIFEDKVAFCKFKHLALSDYPELKDLWYGQLNHNVFCNLKSLVVQKCDFLSHVLLPSNVMQALHGLEELEVTDCDSLEAVFDVKGMKSNEILIKQSTQLKKLTLSSLPKLKHIWNDDPHEIINFGNLCKVKVSMCQSLLYIFPLSLCQDLGYLEILDIKSCGVEVIVEMVEGSMEINFNFPQLSTLKLCCLTNLKNFYRGKHALECPSLKIFNVYRCEALRMFSFNHSDFQQPNTAGGNPTIPQQALFSMEKMRPNVEELAVNCPDAMEILNQENVFHKVELLRLQRFDETPTIFLNDFFTAFPHLKTFQVRNSSFETLFPTKATISHCSLQISNQIRTLFLYELENLKHIWQEDFPLDHPLLQDLEILSAWNCPSLISLVPSSTSFTNLTFLKVDNCKELIYLITSSTAKSLVQLTTLIIRNCENMLDVVKIDEEKAEENIVFENFECLELSSLPSFRSFCYGKQAFIFPSFIRFIVKGCPQMKIFSSGVTVAPCLRVIFVEEGKMRWKGDLNTTIEQLFIEQEVPHSNVE